MNSFKEYHIFSFTNYEGFKKAVRILERNKRYKHKKITGRIIFIKDLSDDISSIRESATYEGLKTWLNCGHIIPASDIVIRSWYSFQTIKETFKELEEKGEQVDIFGEFKIELR